MKQGSLTEAELTALGQAVVRNMNWLSGHLDHPQRNELDLHLPIAGILRVMLCDADTPILLIFAREQEVPLRVWAASPALKPVHTDLLFAFNALIWSKCGTRFSWQALTNFSTSST